MKKMLRTMGLVCLICAVLLFAIAGLAEDKAQGSKVSYGVVLNGSFTETGSGYMGRNESAIEDMGWLKGISILTGLLGIGGIIGSAVINEETPQY